MEELVRLHLRFTSLMEKRARKAFLDSIRFSLVNTDLSAALDSIRSGQTPYLEQSVTERLIAYDLPLTPLEIVLRDSFIGGARITAKAYGNTIAKAQTPQIRYDFNPALPDAMAWATTNAADVVTNINLNTREAIRRRVLKALQDGEAPWELAKELESVIGLRPQDVIAVEKMRDALLLTKTKSAAHKAAKDYARRLLSQRATLIARTEVLKASNHGQQAYWKQGVAEGAIDDQLMERVWIATIPSERTCPTCGALDGTRAPIDGLWAGKYEVAHAHPQCRCTSGLVFINNPTPRPKIKKASTAIVSKFDPRFEDVLYEQLEADASLKTLIDKYSSKDKEATNV